MNCTPTISGRKNSDSCARWASSRRHGRPLPEGMKGMFSEPVLTEIARRHGKSVPQVILRWNIQRGVSVIPKSVHKERMRENMDVWDFELDGDDMALIGTLDKNRPSMLDPLKPSEVKRLYDYLKNPVLTSLQ